MHNSYKYNEKLTEESAYWHRKTIAAFKDGCPPWVDRRRYLYEQHIKGNLWALRIDDQIRGREIRRIIEIAVKSGGKVLDLGSGSGWLSLELARQGLDVHGIDLSKEQIKIAESFANLSDDRNVAPILLGFELKGRRGTLTYEVGDLNFIELPSDTYDTIAVWDTLHHISELDHLMLQIVKSLKRGGVLVITDHNYRYPLVSWIISKMRRLSPFEDVSLGKVDIFVSKYFEGVYRENHLAFTHLFKGLLDLLHLRDSTFKFYLMKSIRTLDDFLVKSKLIKGEYIFILAHKN